MIKIKRFLWIKLTALTLCLLLISGSGFKSTQGIEQVSKEDFFKNLPPILQKYLPYSSEFKILFDSGIITSEAELPEAKSRLEELKQSLPKETFIPLTPEEEKELKGAWEWLLRNKQHYLRPGGNTLSVGEKFPNKNFHTLIINDTLTNQSDLGSREITASVIVYNWLGAPLVSFHHTLNWQWNTTIITSVTTSTWGICHQPGWWYAGLTSASGYYYNNQAAYNSYRQGCFQLRIWEIPIFNIFTWISADIFRGGGYRSYGSWTENP